MPDSVTVITGPARSGKTWGLLQEYRAALKGGGRRAEGGGPESSFGLQPSALSPQPLALWLAPTARAAAAVRESLFADGLTACLSPGVLTFEKLADRILAASRLRPLSPVTQRELMRRVVQRALDHDSIKYYRDAARRPSFIELVLETISELKQRGIDPAQFVASPPTGRDPEAHGELAGLYFDYEEQLAAHLLCDAEGRHSSARDALRDGESAWPPPLELVVVDGFTDFTATQLDILKHLAARARRLRISLPSDAARSPRTDLFAKPTATLAELRCIFPDLEVKALPTRPTDWPALDHLNNHLFRNPNHIPPFNCGLRISDCGLEVDNPQSAIRNPQLARRLEIIAAASEHNEIVQLARHIKGRLLSPLPPGVVATGTDAQRWSRAGEGAPQITSEPSPCPLPEGEGIGVRPADIVVVFRTLHEAAPRVREVFTEFGIPFALGSDVPLVRAPVLRSLMSLLRLDAEGWPFRRAVSVLTNNALAAIGSEVRAQAEWLVRELQVANGRDALVDRIAELADEAAKQEFGENNEATIARGDRFQRRIQAAFVTLPILRNLARALDDLPQAAPLDEWITALERLGAEVGLAPFQPSPGPGEGPGEGSGTCTDPENVVDAPRPTSSNPENSAVLAERIDEIAWQAIVRHFTSLVRLDERLGQPPRRFTRNDLVALLVDLATHESLPRPHDEIGRVRILSAVAARTISAKHLYLAGMTEQAFPSPERAGRLYSDREYNTLSPAPSPRRGGRGEGAETYAPTRAQDEMLLFYEVLTRATETLTISYAALDAKAQSLPPSPYVTEVERTVGRENIRRTESKLSPLPTEQTPYSQSEWRVYAVAQALQDNCAPLAGLAANTETQTVAAAIDAGLRTIHARSRRERFSPFEGLLESPALRARLAERFGPTHLWSPSQWEQYAFCPYRFFLESVLGLEPLGELTLETDHARRGSLLHDVLAAFHRELLAAIGPDGVLSNQAGDELSARFADTLERAIRGTRAFGVDAALLELDRRQIDKWSRRYFEEQEKYSSNWSNFTRPPTPAHFEVRFGPARLGESDEDARSTNAPFVLDLGEEVVHITGRIDRIDVGRAGEQIVFNVIDYKSGTRPSLTAGKIETGQRLQPALYVMAAEALLFADDGAKPVWAGYWSMKNGVTTDKNYSLRCSSDGVEESQDWQRSRQQVKDRIHQFVTDIRRGAFPVHSCDDQCTSRCDFNTVCRISQIRSLDKIWPDESGEKKVN